VSKRFVFAIIQTPFLNERLKFKHTFEKKARRTRGKYVTFSVLSFWCHRKAAATGWLRKALKIFIFRGLIEAS
jgi:hypothetical protein